MLPEDEGGAGGEEVRAEVRLREGAVAEVGEGEAEPEVREGRGEQAEPQGGVQV